MVWYGTLTFPSVNWYHSELNWANLAIRAGSVWHGKLNLSVSLVMAQEF